MAKVALEIDDDCIDSIVRNALRQTYVDTVTVWKNQEYADELAAALLTVIGHYTDEGTHKEWLEKINER